MLDREFHVGHVVLRFYPETFVINLTRVGIDFGRVYTFSVLRGTPHMKSAYTRTQIDKRETHLSFVRTIKVLLV